MRAFLLLAVLAIANPGSAMADGYGKTSGLLGPVLVGPKLSLIRLPTGPSAGLELKAFGLFGAWFDYGLLPPIKVREFTAEFRTWNVGAKIYPFRGSFFLGCGYGSYTASVKGNLTENDQPYSARLSASPKFVSPRLGWLWSWQNGFFMSMDLGWQFPLDFKSKLEVPSGFTAGDLGTAQNDIDKYGKKGLPDLGLLELGWLF